MYARVHTLSTTSTHKSHQAVMDRQNIIKSILYSLNSRATCMSRVVVIENLPFIQERQLWMKVCFQEQYFLQNTLITRYIIVVVYFSNNFPCTLNSWGVSLRVQ